MSSSIADQSVLTECHLEALKRELGFREQIATFLVQTDLVGHVQQVCAEFYRQYLAEHRDRDLLLKPLIVRLPLQYESLAKFGKTISKLLKVLQLIITFYRSISASDNHRGTDLLRAGPSGGGPVRRKRSLCPAGTGGTAATTTAFACDHCPVAANLLPSTVAASPARVLPLSGATSKR